VPTGASNKGADDDHLPVLSTAASNAIVRYTAASAWCIVRASRLLHRAENGAAVPGTEYGYVIGYNYHGGHANTPWPTVTAAPPPGPLPAIDRRSDVGPGFRYERLVAGLRRDLRPAWKEWIHPHRRRYSNADASGASSADIGGAGGNVGLLDGSVAWKNVIQMRIYRGSQQWGDSGCRAMW